MAEALILAEASPGEVRTALRAYEARRDRLVLDVLETYEAVLRIERQLDADAAFLSRADRFLRLTRAREAQGRATRACGLARLRA